MPKTSNNLWILIMKRNQRNNLSDLAGQTATTLMKRPGQDKNCQTETSGGKTCRINYAGKYIQLYANTKE